LYKVVIHALSKVSIVLLKLTFKQDIPSHFSAMNVGEYAFGSLVDKSDIIV
jgi:hypothetical protein